MPFTVICRSCSNMLQAPDHLIGRRAKCAACGAVVVVDEISIPEALPLHRSQRKPKQPLAEKPVPADEPEWAIPLDPELKPREAVVAAEEVEILEALPNVAEEVPEATPVETPPRKRRKRKRQKDQLDEEQKPSRMRWYVGLGAFLLVFAICVTIAAYAGLWPFMILRGIQLAILFPFSLVILILSMFISSSITGGIDFGEVQTAVPKAIMLLVLVDSVALVPIYGMFLTFPVWIFGLMAFFQLDIWEARVMIAINWVGNTLVQFFLLAIIITAIQHIGEKDHDDQPIDQPPAIQQQDDRVPGPGQNEMEK